MHEVEKKIRDGLKQIAAEHGPVMLFDGEVIAVDSTDYFCDVKLDTDDEDIVYNVRLRAASIGNQSIDVLPKVGSEVTIAKIAQDDFILVAADEIDSYRVTVGTMVLTQDATGFKISNGTDTLKGILHDLVTEILGIYAPKDIAGITAIQTRINALLQ